MTRLDDNQIAYVPFYAHEVEAVDALVEVAKRNGSYSKRLESEADWNTMEAIYLFWRRLYPDEVAGFEKAQALIRRNLKNRHASHREAGGAEIQHQMNIPPHLWRLIKIFFPDESFDKRTVASFVKRLPLFRIPETHL